MTRFEAKDPDDIDDFTLDWSTLTLATGETISTATATVVAPASGAPSVSGSVTISGSKTTTRLTGGTADTVADVRVRITTSAGRQIDETMRIPVEVQ